MLICGSVARLQVNRHLQNDGVELRNCGKVFISVDGAVFFFFAFQKLHSENLMEKGFHNTNEGVGNLHYEMMNR